MFHVGFALLALVPAVLPCGGIIGHQGGQPEDRLIHVHVVAFGKAFCAFATDDGKFPSAVSLELGNRASPNDYRKINSTEYTGRPGGVEFALAGDYSYDPQTTASWTRPGSVFTATAET